MSSELVGDMPVVIGVDLGTTAVKAAAYGVGGRIGAVARRSTSGAASEVGGSPLAAVQRIAALRAATLDAVAEAVAAAPRKPDAVAVSTAMHGLVGLGPDGTPVTELVTWDDDRAASVVAGWVEDGSAGFIHERTGVPLHPMAPLAKLAWFAEQRPATAAAVDRWVDLKALAVQWLTSDAVTECSSASGWGLMDIRSHRWDAAALDLAQVDSTRLPTIESPTATRPLSASAAEHVGLAVGTPVVLGAADGPLGNVGVGAIKPGVAGLSLGTSGAVRLVVDEVPPAIPGLFCYALAERQWVVGGAVSNGGNIVGWLANTLLDGSDVGRPPSLDAVLDLAGGAPPGSEGLVMLPYLVGERAPLWDAEVPGAWLGLRRRHTRAHMARAALEGVAAGLGVITDRLNEVASVDEVRATGGAFASPLWQQIVAAAIGRPMAIVHADDGSALGAAAMGLLALEAAVDLAEARALLVGDIEDDAAPVPVPDGWAAAAMATRRAIATNAGQLADVADAYRRS